MPIILCIFNFVSCYSIPIFSGCEQIQQVTTDKITVKKNCTAGKRVLNFGFYAYFAPVSYSANEDANSEGFNVHQGYEADLLTALEAMEDADLSFSRSAIVEWHGIWLKAADPEYDIIGGGITILDSRTQGRNRHPRSLTLHRDISSSANRSWSAPRTLNVSPVTARSHA